MWCLQIGPFLMGVKSERGLCVQPYWHSLFVFWRWLWFFSLLIKLKILSVRILIKLTTFLINERLLRSSVGDFNVKRGFFVQIKLSLYNTDVSDCTVKNTITIFNILSPRWYNCFQKINEKNCYRRWNI